MYPQSAPLSADIALHCTNEELCISLEKIMRGSPLPGNVIPDVHPYQYMPSNLPDGLWYYISSNESKATNLGHWRAKGEASRIFSNSFFTGWRTTLEFYEGHAPTEIKTNWVMQEYWITHKNLCEGSDSKESRALCRIFPGDEATTNCQKLQKMVNSDGSHSTHPIAPQAENCVGRGSTSKPEVSKDNERGTLLGTDRLPDQSVESIPEGNYFSRGDYLELLDLDTPASFSSASSCLTMSSDECFDSLALLEELDQHLNSQDPLNNNAGCKFSIAAPLKPDELVMYAEASSGPFNKSPSKQRIRNHDSIPGSSVGGKITEGGSSVGGKITEGSSNTSQNQKPDFRNEGPSDLHRVVGRTKKLKKYFCFMPF